jgi:diketogulonate reductase-like aldo/keto reductase
VVLVSKVYPWHAGGTAMRRACENSLRRLQTDYLDMYLLHWRGDIPLQETVEAMERLVAEGKIRRWGVSNLDTDDMQALWRTAVANAARPTRCSIISHRGALNTISCPGASSTLCR